LVRLTAQVGNFTEIVSAGNERPDDRPHWSDVRMMNTPSDPRAYPDRPVLAVSAAIIRDGRVFIARRARGPALGVWTMPGGMVEVGETLTEALTREILEETAMTIEPVALAGHREVVVRDESRRPQRHFVILCFASRWVSGEPVLNDELDDSRWIRPSELKDLKTTEGLDSIVAAAFERMEALV
jgi:ADP-ribose pyrophosphatase YjhB (NUDIX family)